MDNKYSFLQEKIKDEAGSPKKRRKKIFRIMILGLLLGTFACFGFFTLKPWAENLFAGEAEEVSIPEDSAEEAKDYEETVKKQEEDNYLKVLNKLQGVAKDAVKSMVSISGEDKDSDKEVLSGIILADNGRELIIAGQNFASDNIEEMNVTFCDENVYPAEIKVQDTNIGIGVYTVRKSAMDNETLEKISVAELGNSYIVKSGEPVIVLAKGKNAADVISYGLIASTEEQMEVADRSEGILRADTAGTEFDHGVFVSSEGKVLGIIPHTKEKEGKKLLVTAYEISDIKNELELMANGNTIPYLGIYGTKVVEKMQEEGIPAGIYVKRVEKDSPAMEEGIQRGDVITHVMDQEVTSMQEYQNILFQQKENMVLTIKCQRIGADGEYTEIECKVSVGAKE